jgi:hypothetical protein
MSFVVLLKGDGEECSSEFSFLWTGRSALNKHYLSLHVWRAVQVDQ